MNTLYIYEFFKWKVFILITQMEWRITSVTDILWRYVRYELRVWSNDKYN